MRVEANMRCTAANSLSGDKAKMRNVILSLNRIESYGCEVKHETHELCPFSSVWQVE